MIFIFSCTAPLAAQDWFPEGASWTYMYGVVSGPDQFQAALEVTGQSDIEGALVSKIELTDDNGAGFMTCQVLTLPL